MAWLAHKTVGRLSPARDNVVLIPSWYSGTHWEAEVGLVGPRRAISPEKHFIALTGLLGGALWAGTAIFNMVFLLSLKLDPIFAGGFFRRPPLDGLKAFDAIYADWGFSEPSYRTEAFRQFGVRTDEELVQYFWESVFVHHDANNLLAMLWTNATYGGDFDRALGAIKTRTIVMPCQYESCFPPADSESEASRIRGAKCVIIPSIWGHMTPWNPKDAFHRSSPS